MTPVLDFMRTRGIVKGDAIAPDVRKRLMTSRKCRVDGIECSFCSLMIVASQKAHNAKEFDCIVSYLLSFIKDQASKSERIAVDAVASRHGFVMSTIPGEMSQKLVIEASGA